MRILFLITLFGCFAQSYGAFVKQIEGNKTRETTINDLDEPYLQKQVSLASQLEKASTLLKTILSMDPDGSAKKDLGAFEAQLDCAIEVINTGIETSIGTINKEDREGFSCNDAPAHFYEKRKGLRKEPDGEPPVAQSDESLDHSLKISKNKPIPISHANRKKSESTLQRNFNELQQALDKLTQDLGQEFMTEVAYPWFQRNRMRIGMKANTEGFPFQHALLLCVLETSLETAQALNKERSRNSRNVMVPQENPLYTSASKTWHALSIILASGLCDLSDWKLPSYHAWAQPAFRLIQNNRVRRALNIHKIEIVKGLYLALSQRDLELSKRIDLFLYLVKPEIAARRYCAQLRAGKKERSDCRKQTPLIWAVMFDHVHTLLSILKALDDQDLESSDDDDALFCHINEEDAEKLAAIDYACLLSHTTCIDLLMLAGSETPRVTTLLRLVKKGNTESLESLLNYMEMPPEVEAAAHEHKKTAVIDLFEKHHRSKKASPVVRKKARRGGKNNK